VTQIAVLYPGAMGRALAEALAPFDHSLVAHLTGRSTRTQENARGAGIRAMASLEELADTAEIVVSVVPPGAALLVAGHYAAALGKSRRWTHAGRRPLFLDANSVAPSTIRAIENVIGAAGGDVVDGVFLGPSNLIGDRTLLMLSGPHANVAAEILGPAIAVKVVGDTVGHASSVKMAIALVTKAFVTLFLEMSCAAGKAGCLDSTLEVMRDQYPGFMEFLERNLPTYPTHAARRVVEMREVQVWLAGLGQSATMTKAATIVLERVSHAGLEVGIRSFEELLHEIIAREPFATRA
jgi:3-hydroxyisobutyrate dehydrogenase-like beta-hydroxyacid dehydrogenase